MIVKTSNQVSVRINVFYQETDSNPMLREYLFAYRVVITNYNDFPIKLIKRHWDICDGSCQKRTLEGEGAVGLQPIIGSNKEFSYVSGVPLSAEIGKMSGWYEVVNYLTKEEFQVEIPEFILEAPIVLN